MAPTTLLSDPARVDACRALLDAPRSVAAELARIAEVAADLCGVAVGSVNLLSGTEQRTLAGAGLGGATPVCSIEQSMCATVIAEPLPVVVPDCRDDPRMEDNPYVTGELASVRFYASARLVSSGGQPVGTLCVVDDEVHHLDPWQRAALGVLADRVVDVLELELQRHELRDSAVGAAESHEVAARTDQLLAFLAAEVGHELRTPLTAMVLSLSLAREELHHRLGDDPSLALVDQALEGSRRLAGAVDDLVALARTARGMRRVAVDLSAVLRLAVADLGPALVGVGLDVEPLPTVPGDPGQLRTLLVELLERATSSADPDRPMRISVRAVRTGRTWRVEVSDTGTCCPAAEPRAAWRRVVLAHGGALGVVPVVGGGTTAWFELPA